MDNNKDINIAKDYRILVSVAKHGVDVIPYDIGFLSRYGLKQLFLTYFDVSTSAKKKDVSLNIIKKHICEAAFAALPGDIKKFDQLILDSFSCLGFEFLNSLFNNLDYKIKNDFLFQYSLFQSYREFMDSINYPKEFPEFQINKIPYNLKTT